MKRGRLSFACDLFRGSRSNLVKLCYRARHCFQCCIHPNALAQADSRSKYHGEKMLRTFSPGGWSFRRKPRHRALPAKLNILPVVATGET
jgi:hypothetical protein